MRDELMKFALSWDHDAIIPAEFAHGHHFACYCPDIDCLAEVHARKKVNTYFVAEARHVLGCKNDTERKDENSHSGTSKPKPALIRPDPIPTHLGAAPTHEAKIRRPTKDELRELLRRVDAKVLLYPGTLDEVVAAWLLLTEEERKIAPLSIGGVASTYETAFHFLPWNSRSIDDLPWEKKIIFGAADVMAGKVAYLVHSQFRVSDGEHISPLRVSMSKENPLLANLPALVGREATLFWFGPRPSLVVGGKSSAFKLPRVDSPYGGAIVLQGHLSPRINAKGELKSWR